MIKSQALGGRSNKVLIFLGLFLGLVSAVLVVVYLKQAGGEGGGTSGGVVTPVVVASQSIPLGTHITEDMVTLNPLSSDAVLADAYRDTGDVVGQVTRVPLVAGEQVIPTKVTATGAAIPDMENPPLAYVVEEGKRGMAIQVDSVIGASGLIRPGDYVDVILTVKIEGEEGAGGEANTARVKDQLARTILQNVEVLSIGQDVARTVVDKSEDTSGGTGSVVEESSEANPEATTVTLAVSPVHGEVLTVAEACGQNFGGRLALALRAFGDSGAVETRSVWAENGAPPTCAGLLGLPGLQ
jgi:pilus assembly protein CpaB